MTGDDRVTPDEDRFPKGTDPKDTVHAETDAEDATRVLPVVGAEADPVVPTADDIPAAPPVPSLTRPAAQREVEFDPEDTQSGPLGTEWLLSALEETGEISLPDLDSGELSEAITVEEIEPEPEVSTPDDPATELLDVVEKPEAATEFAPAATEPRSESLDDPVTALIAVPEAATEFAPVTPVTPEPRSESLDDPVTELIAVPEAPEPEPSEPIAAEPETFAGAIPIIRPSEPEADPLTETHTGQTPLTQETPLARRVAEEVGYSDTTAGAITLPGATGSIPKPVAEHFPEIADAETDSVETDSVEAQSDDAPVEAEVERWTPALPEAAADEIIVEAEQIEEIRTAPEQDLDFADDPEFSQPLSARLPVLPEQATPRTARDLSPDGVIEEPESPPGAEPDAPAVSLETGVIFNWELTPNTLLDPVVHAPGADPTPAVAAESVPAPVPAVAAGAVPPVFPPAVVTASESESELESESEPVPAASEELESGPELEPVPEPVPAVSEELEPEPEPEPVPESELEPVPEPEPVPAAVPAESLEEPLPVYPGETEPETVVTPAMTHPPAAEPTIAELISRVRDGRGETADIARDAPELTNEPFDTPGDDAPAALPIPPIAGDLPFTDATGPIDLAALAEYDAARQAPATSVAPPLPQTPRRPSAFSGSGSRPSTPRVEAGSDGAADPGTPGGSDGSGPRPPSKSGGRGGRKPWLLAAGGVGFIGILAGLYALSSMVAGGFAGPAEVAATARPTPSQSSEPTAIPQPAPVKLGVLPWTELRGGECLNPFENGWANEFTSVSCIEPHAAQLLAPVPISEDPAAEFPGEAALAAGSALACGDSGRVNAGALTDLQVQAVYPVTAEQWAAGQRDYQCFISRSSGEPLTSSLLP